MVSLNAKYVTVQVEFHLVLYIYFRYKRPDVAMFTRGFPILLSLWCPCSVFIGFFKKNAERA